MRYRVLKKHEFLVAGQPRTINPGSVVEIELRSDREELQHRGIIGPWRMSHKAESRKADPAPRFAKTLRVGFWLATSNHYSGGRLHLYQMAWTLAEIGAEVWLVTDGIPKWTMDYPEAKNLQLVVNEPHRIPRDLDVVITDSKGPRGDAAWKWAEEHPGALFVGMNFETPDWVEKYAPDYARRLTQRRDIFLRAHYMLANSEESRKYLIEWLAKDVSCGVLYPSVNDYPIGEAEAFEGVLGDRPYMVMSARAADYKGADVAMDAVWSLDQPMDLVMIGQPHNLPKETELHKAHPKKGISEREKLALMMRATAILAPSRFEGAGMVPMEGLCCGTPTVVYDLPVLREIYGDRLVYAEWGDAEDFKAKVRAVAGGEAQPEEVVSTDQARRTYGMGAMRERIENLPYFAVQRKRVSAQLISYWGFCPETLESVYPYADEIFIAYGRVPHAKAVDDGTLERLREFPDPDGKIVIEARDTWNGGKIEMRQWCIDRMSGNFHLLLDGDEIWTGLDEWLEADIAFGCPRWVNLWHGTEHWVHDYPGETHRWGKPLSGGGSVCPHYRWSWLRRSYRFRSHSEMVDANDQPLRIIGSEAAEKVPGCFIYHLGQALPKAVMEAKHDFYLSRDGVDEGRVMRKKAWHDWNGKTGDCGDGIVEPVDWDVPDIVKRAYERIAEWQVK